MNTISSEMLINNYLDESFQALLRPLNLLQRIFFQQKYKIKDNFITPNGFLEYGKCLLGCLLFSGILVARGIIYAKSNYNQNKYFHTAIVYDVFGYSFGFIINLIINIKYSLKTVDLIIIIQSLMRTHKSKEIVLKFNVILKICIFLLVIFYTIYIIRFFVHKFIRIEDVTEGISTFTLMSLDINMMYATLIIVLIRKELDTWIQEVKDRVGVYDFNRNGEYVIIDWEKMQVVYSNILEAFENCKDLFQAVILYYTLEIFFNTLIYIQVLISSCEVTNNFRNYVCAALTAMYLLPWLFKNLFIEVILGIECEKLYTRINEVQAMCSALLKTNLCTEEKSSLKNVKRLNQAKFSKMTACGLFSVDTALPLRMIGVLATYTVVLLQFALVQ